MDVLQFVKEDEVDPIYFESSYYVAPEEKTTKPYTLFTAALRETGRHAIAKIAMHNREHIALIRTAENRLLLHTLYFANELHAANRGEAAAAKYTAGELDLAKKLVAQLTSPFRPAQFQDTYRESVEKLIEQKSKGRKVTPIKQPKQAPVADLMEALKRSLASQASATGKGAKRSPRRRAA